LENQERIARPRGEWSIRSAAPLSNWIARAVFDCSSQGFSRHRVLCGDAGLEQIHSPKCRPTPK
jgi:hypothetical protein